MNKKNKVRKVSSKEVFKTLRVEDDWCCRASVIKRVDDTYFDFADFALSRGVNYEDDFDQILECMDEYYDISDWTHEELVHIAIQLSFACAYRELMNLGYLEEVSPGQLKYKKKNGK